MCQTCEDLVDAARPSLDRLLDAERTAYRLYPNETPAQHTMRLTGDLVAAFHDSGHDIVRMCTSFALTVQKLLAVQQIYGIPTV